VRPTSRSVIDFGLTIPGDRIIPAIQTVNLYRATLTSLISISRCSLYSLVGILKLVKKSVFRITETTRTMMVLMIRFLHPLHRKTMERNRMRYMRDAGVGQPHALARYSRDGYVYCTLRCFLLSLVAYNPSCCCIVSLHYTILLCIAYRIS